MDFYHMFMKLVFIKDVVEKAIQNIPRDENNTFSLSGVG